MFAQEIIDNLLIGELSQLKVAKDINSGDYAAFVSSLNLGLTALYKRFKLDTDYIYVNQVEHISRYELKDQFRAANTGSTEPYKYIDDTAAFPFEPERLIEITAIENELGELLPFNDDNNISNVYVPKYNTIYCSGPVSDNTWKVFYTKDHEKIEVTDFDPLTQEIDIPSAYLEPLLYYIASRHHSGAGTLKQAGAGDSYLVKFEMACQELERLNLVQHDMNTNLRLEDNGWV